MHLLTPSQGWVQTDQGLEVTSDGGATWKTITPPGATGQILGEPFFLDAGQGWVVGSGTYQDVQSGSNAAVLYATADGGDTWMSSTIPLPPAVYVYRSFYLDFVDNERGWLSVDLGSHGPFDYAALLGTTDGGATWATLHAPIAGHLYFATRTDGWIEGGEGAARLFETHDAGASWEPVSATPTPIGEEVEVAYGLPHLWDAQDGALAATITVGQSSSKVAFYRTYDGGLTWDVATTVALPEATAAPATPSDIVDPNLWLVEPLDLDGMLAETTDGGDTAALVEESGLPAQPSAISFPKETTGWALAAWDQCAKFKSDCSSYSELLVTADGGKTWTRLTP